MFFDCESNSCCKDCMTNFTLSIPVSHSFDLFQFYLQKILYPRCSSPVAWTPRKLIRHITSDFDRCEIDLDMQMRCLNAALWTKLVLFQTSSQGRTVNTRRPCGEGRETCFFTVFIPNGTAIDFFENTVYGRELQANVYRWKYVSGCDSFHQICLSFE